MQFEHIEFQIAGEEILPPDDKKSADIYSRIGYSLEEALADLIDNSIDAQASQVLIRFMTEPGGIRSVMIIDNGRGMKDEELKEAMRFGSKTSKNEEKLGKYGIGLKSASLSQASSVTVFSKNSGNPIGRRWTTESIGRGWKCQVIDRKSCSTLFQISVIPLDISRQGTVIIWEHLEHLKTLPENLQRTLDRAIKKISNELGLKFHRFLESGQIKIYIDTQEIGEEPSGICLPVKPLNPFLYETSGNRDYPKAFQVPLQIRGTVSAECHIWPPKSNSPNYKLGGGKTAARQGFYFYRNDRLIQAGGWNGCRDDDAEPHLSLARVRIELPPKLDSSFKLDVAKSIVDPPPAFIHGALAAKSETGSFRQFLLDAQLAYRKQKTKDGARFPFIPGVGFPASARTKVRLAFSEKGTAKPQSIAFKWRSLGHDTVVEVDASKGELILNSKFKKELGGSATNDGAPIKLLMLLVLQNPLSRSFETEKGRDWLQRVNIALLASLKTQ